MTTTPSPHFGPVRIGIDYLPHQETGIAWMLEREADDAPFCRGGILADDMGLGKTFQTIGLLKNCPLPLKTLIVCPPALIAGWTSELTACGYKVFHNASVEASAEDTVWLTSYPKVCTQQLILTRAAFQRVILDEGHIVRNGESTARYRSCKAIAQDAVCRWILSATPVQNGPRDWRNLCRWLGVPDKDIVGAAVMLRRTMAELRDTIAALPPSANFVTHDLSISGEGQEGRLFRILCDQLEHVVERSAMSSLIKLEMWMRIQQFLVHPQLYIQAMRESLQRKGITYQRDDWRSDARCTKWTAAMTVLAKAVSDRRGGTIVFCNFRAEMDMVAAAAQDMGAIVFSIRGGMSSELVGRAVDEAKAAVASGLAVVIVVQIVSGGTGLNLQFCDCILFLSQHWNPAVVHQAVGRAVRIGQKAVVQIHMFRIVDDVLDNIDRRMVQIHISKIAGAQEICQTLYEGFAPLVEIPEGKGYASDDEEEEEGDPSAPIDCI